MKQKIEIFFCERECFEKGSNISGGTETRVLSETAEAHKSTLDQESDRQRRQNNNVTCRRNGFWTNIIFKKKIETAQAY